MTSNSDEIHAALVAECKKELEGIPSGDLPKLLDHWRAEVKRNNRLDDASLRKRAEAKAWVEAIETILKNPGQQAGVPAKKPLTERKPNDFGPGELMEKVQERAKRDGCPLHQTVPAMHIRKWIKEFAEEGKTTTPGSIRSALTELGYTKERKKKK